MSLVKAKFIGDDAIRLEAAGGVAIQGTAAMNVALGERMMAVKLALEKDFVHPWHNHPEHESFGVVLKGRLEMRIGDRLVRLGPGDLWHHPVRVYHSTKALEPTLALECHAPVRPDLARLAEKERRGARRG